jgi:DNA polymerase I
MPSLDLHPQPQVLLVTAENLPRALKLISAEVRVIALDTETTGLDPLQSDVRIRLLQLGLSDPSAPVLIFDLFTLGEEVMAPVWELLCIDVDIPAHRIRCSMLQERLLTCGKRQARMKGSKAPAQFIDVIETGEDPSFEDLPCSLEASVARRLHLQLIKEEQKSNWGAPTLSQSQLAYAALDAKATLNLHIVQEGLLRFDKGLAAVAALENRLVWTVAAMSLWGMPVDRPHWERLVETLSQEQQEHEQLFVEALDQALLAAGSRGVPRDLFGEVDLEALNLRHAPTLLSHLNRLGFGLPDLNKQTISLAEIDHPVMNAFVTWRKGESLLRYARAFVKQIRPSGRVHCRISQARANSGRLAASSPNLMNIPRDSRYRQGFRAPDGWKIIGADYSQIEPRLMAAISGDAALTEVFVTGKDVYKATAALTAGVDIKDIDSQARQNGKIAVLALMYGMGWQKFQRYAWTQFGVRKSDSEAQSERDAFFKAYPGIAKYHRECAELLEDKSKAVLESRSVLGRRRFLEGADRSYSTLINNKIQSTAADAMKVALANLPEALWAEGCEATKVISVIHDEVLLEAPDEEVETACRVLEQVMVAAATPFLNGIPVQVDAVAGQTWADTKR